MNKVILLTSTVTPNIKSVGTKEDRLEEYKQAVSFYLNHTNLRIVIVDNSNFDFSVCFPNEHRLECLFYEADNSDLKFGKGYCEAKIILFAIEHSNFISLDSQIIKITGRHIIGNINNLLSFSNKLDTVYADVDIHYKYAHSYFLIAPYEFYINYFINHVSEMNDSKGIHMEHVLANALLQWRYSGHNHSMFILPINIIGHPGNSHVSYTSPSISRYIMIISKWLICKIQNGTYQFYHMFK